MLRNSNKDTPVTYQVFFVSTFSGENRRPTSPNPLKFQYVHQNSQNGLTFIAQEGGEEPDPQDAACEGLGRRQNTTTKS